MWSRRFPGLTDFQHQARYSAPASAFNVQLAEEARRFQNPVLWRSSSFFLSVAGDKYLTRPRQCLLAFFGALEPVQHIPYLFRPYNRRIMLSQMLSASSASSAAVSAVWLPFHASVFHPYIYTFFPIYKKDISANAASNPLKLLCGNINLFCFIGFIIYINSITYPFAHQFPASGWIVSAGLLPFQEPELRDVEVVVMPLKPDKFLVGP